MGINLFITGATSHTGSRLVRKLVEKSYTVKCLLHNQDRKNLLPNVGEKIVLGSLDKPEEFINELSGIEAIINVAHIRFSPQIINVCKQTGIKRAIFLSSQRRFTKFPCESSKAVIEAESLIEKSELDYTIMRSAMIYGGSNDNNVTKMVAFIKKSPIFPLYNNGKNLIQPVFVWDLVDAIIAALENPISVKKTYDIAGPEPITYKDFVESIARALNKKIYFIPYPLNWGIVFLKFLEKLGVKLPITSEQLQRLQEDKTTDISLAKKELNFSPHSFKEGINQKITRADV